jgi:hypothetical protein
VGQEFEFLTNSWLTGWLAGAAAGHCENERNSYPREVYGMFREVLCFRQQNTGNMPISNGIMVVHTVEYDTAMNTKQL